MKHLHGDAEASVGVRIDDCLRFLAALEAYPNWYPDVVREVEVVETGKGGLPLRAETKLHLSWGPVSRDLDLLLAVRVQRPGLVQLSHVPRGPSGGASFDATWRLEDRATHLVLELDDDAGAGCPARRRRRRAGRLHGSRGRGLESVFLRPATNLRSSRPVGGVIMRRPLMLLPPRRRTYHP
jgi:hypothetical protein